MSMMQWVKGLVEGKHETDMSIHTQAEDEEAGGLNFKTAINAHISWKRRLRDYINGNSDEVLDHSTISSDKNCALGQWIYGEGDRHYGEVELFKNLKHSHKQFHECAGNIVLEVDKGNHNEALQLIAADEYARASTQVTSQLAQLYIQFRGK